MRLRGGLAEFQFMPSRFKVLKSLEDNTTSTLQLVRDSHLKSDFLLRRFKTTDAGEIEGLVRLFAQLAVIESPRLDRIVEAGMDQKGFFVLTPAPLEGITLTEMIQRGPLSADEFEVLVTQLLDAVELVHDRSMVHGTLTPDCVRIVGVKPSEWVVKLGGFGVGFSAAGTEVSQQVAAYRCAAPEQWQKTAARRRTDIYSLGCVFYEALAGRPAFQSRGLKELRAKHLSHDLQDLAALAPHVPRWMTAWVMSLIVTDSEVRPRKASVARENFARREVPDAPPGVAQAPVAAPVVSESVALPVMNLARSATASTIPITVGLQVGPVPPVRRVVPSPMLPKPAVKQFSQQPQPRQVWKKPLAIALAGAGVLVVAFWVFKSGPDAANAPAAGAPTLFEAPAPDPHLRTFRALGPHRQRYFDARVRVPTVPYPKGLPTPVAASRLVVHLHPDFGLGTYEGADGDKPAHDGDAVAFWRDLGTAQGDNAMGAVPWNPRDRRITLQVRKPEQYTFELRSPRRFVVFGPGSKTVSALGTLGALAGSGVAFGDAGINGVTFAIVFYAHASDEAAMRHAARLSFSDHGLSLQLTATNSPRFYLGTSKTPNSSGYLELPKGVELDCTQPTLAIATWSKDGKATAIFRSSSGDRRVASTVVAAPSQSLQNFALGGDSYWVFRDGAVTSPAFVGGIGECRLYNGVFSADDLKKLEDELARHYFP